MSRTVTLRLNESVYERLRTAAEDEERSLSNFIETAALHYLEHEEHVDEFEMQGIDRNRPLKESISGGLADAKEGRGRYV